MLKNVRHNHDHDHDDDDDIDDVVDFKILLCLLGLKASSVFMSDFDSSTVLEY